MPIAERVRTDLQRLGKVLHLSASRNLIVECEGARFVKMGSKVCDSKLRAIGQVRDIFGPVSSPYVAVKPSASSPEKHVHNIVYVLD